VSAWFVNSSMMGFGSLASDAHNLQTHSYKTNSIVTSAFGIAIKTTFAIKTTSCFKDLTSYYTMNHNRKILI